MRRARSITAESDSPSRTVTHAFSPPPSATAIRSTTPGSLHIAEYLIRRVARRDVPHIGPQFRRYEKHGAHRPARPRQTRPFSPSPPPILSATARSVTRRADARSIMSSTFPNAAYIAWKRSRLAVCPTLARFLSRTHARRSSSSSKVNSFFAPSATASAARCPCKQHPVLLQRIQLLKMPC